MTALCARAEVYRFDFGDGALRDGWTKVSPGDARWSGEEVFEKHCAVPDYATLAQSEKQLPVYPNALTCDFAAGAGDTTFSVEVPAGDYACWILFGYASTASDPQIPTYFDTRVATGGEVRDTVRLRAPAHIQERSFSCKADNDKLTFDFSTDGVQWTVAAMMIYRDKDAAKADKEIAAIRKEIDFLPTQLRGRWELRERSDRETLAILTDAERESGYVIFNRGFLHEVYPDSKPTREEIGAAVSTFATPGEFEPLTFSVYPLDDMRITSVAVDLPEATVTVAREVCAPYKEGGYNSHPTGRYCIAPSYLAPIDYRGVALRSRVPVRFWLTAHINDTAKPGVRRGSATITFADGTTHEVPLSVDVLPFRLEKDPSITYGAYYDTRLWFFLNGNWPDYPRRERLGEMVEAYTRAFLADYRDHGMNALSAPVTWTLHDGKPAAGSVDISNRLFAMYREYGLDRMSLYWRVRKDEMIKATQGKVVKQQWRHMPEDLEDPKFYEFLKEVVRVIEAERIKNGWPEIVYKPIDEPYGTKEQVIFAETANRAIKETGVRTYCTMKSWLTRRLSPVVDVRTYGLGFLGTGYPNNDYAHPEETGRSENTRPGQEYWVYPNVLTSRSCAPAASGRFIYGLYGFKTGIQGYNPWHHANWRGNPFNEMDHFYSGGRFVLPGPDGPLPTIAYEGAREGIDDMRYIYTLERAIARTDKPDAAREAAALLVEIRKTVPSFREWVMRYAHTGRSGSKMIDDPDLRELWDLDKPPAWPSDNMQHLRRRLADAIISLQSVPKNTQTVAKLKEDLHQAYKAKKTDKLKSLAERLLTNPDATGKDRGLARYRLLDATIASGADWKEVTAAAHALVNEPGVKAAHVMYGCTSVGQIANSKKNYKEAARWLGKARDILVANDFWDSASVIIRDLSASQWLLGRRGEAAETVIEGLTGMDNAGKPLTFYFQKVWLSRLTGFDKDAGKKLRGQGLALKLAGRTSDAKEISQTFERVKQDSAYTGTGVSRKDKTFFLDCLDKLADDAKTAKKSGGIDPGALSATIAAHRSDLSQGE